MMRTPFATTFLACLVLSCGSDGSSAGDDDDSNLTADAGAEGGPICALESDSELCLRLGKSCGAATGFDLCGNSRTNVACGLCPSPQATCVFVGDASGKTDSSDALAEAIQCAVDHGFTAVSLPKGTYTISKKIVVPPRVPIVGEAEGTFGMNGPTPYDALPLLSFTAADDAIVLSSGASLTGVQLRSSAQSAATHAMIRVAGDAVTISNVKITNGMWGIRSEAAVDAHDLFVSNVFMVAPAGGISIGKATGVSRIENVHVWNNSGDKSLPAFSFSLMSGLSTSLLSAFKYPTAVEVSNSVVDFAGFEGDLCENGIVTLGFSEVHLSGASLISHFTSLMVDGASNVSMSGSHVLTNGNPAIWVKSAAASLAMTGTTILRESAASSAPAVRIDGAKNLAITGNTISAHGVGIYFTGGTKAGAVYGNVIDVIDGASTGWSPAGVGGVTFSGNSTNRAP